MQVIRIGTRMQFVSKTGNYTALNTDDVILCDSSGGAFTVTLPAASTSRGKVLAIKKTDSGTNGVTIDGNSSETIDGALTMKIVKRYDSVSLICDGSNWQIISKDVKIQALVFRQTSSQSISGASDVKIQWNGETSDPHGAFDNSTNYRFTVPTGGSGTYSFGGSIVLAAAATAHLPIYLYKNGSNLRNCGYVGSGTGIGIISAQDEAADGDYYEIYINPQSTSINVISDATITAGSRLNINRT